MSHPEGCHDPDCTLTYRQHLLSVGIGIAALPSRAITRTPGLPDEPTSQTAARQRRLDRDIPAQRRLTLAGYTVPSSDGCAVREQLVNDSKTPAEARFNAEDRGIMIDFYDRGPKPIRSTAEGVTPP